MEGPTEQLKPKDETIDCPFCQKGQITVTHIPSYISWNVSRIAAGSKRTKFIHDPQTTVHSSCPSCGKSKSEIKEMLERGGKQLSHEKQVERIKNAGLPTKLEFKASA